MMAKKTKTGITTEQMKKSLDWAGYQYRRATDIKRAAEQELENATYRAKEFKELLEVLIRAARKLGKEG